MIPFMPKDVRLVDSDINIKQLVNLISHLEDFTRVHLLYTDLVIELGLNQRSSCSTKRTMTAIFVQKLGTKNALEFTLKEWVNSSGEVATSRKLAEAFRNIGLPKIALCIPNITAQVFTADSTDHPKKAKHIKAKFKNDKSRIAKDQTKTLYQNPGEENKLLLNQFECSLSPQKRVFPEYFRRNRKPSFVKNLFRMIFCPLSYSFLTAIMFHAMIDGSYLSNSPVILDQLHDLNNQFQSGLAKILLATQYEEYNSSSHMDLHVTSYIEFQKKMHQYSRSTGTFTVFIDLKYADSWPLDVSVDESKQITKLVFKGNLTRNLMFSILHETKNLKHLVLANSENILCRVWEKDNSNFLRDIEIRLKHLHSVYFENFHSCPQIYKTFSKHTIFDHLKEIHIINGTINDKNKKSIQNFIHGQHLSLTSLYLNSTNLQSNLFDDNMPKLPHVTRLTLDFLTNLYENVSLFGNTCSELFPSLLDFTSEKGRIPFKCFSRFLSCERLTSLSVGVSIEASKSSLNLDFMRNANRALKHVNIAFYFLNKTLNDICEIEGYEEEKKRFPKFTIQTNCNKQIIY